MEVAGEVKIKFIENVPSSKDGIIIITEGETLAKVIKKEYQRRYNTLVIRGVRILNNPELLVIIKEIPIMVSRPESAMALKRATVKIIIANKIIIELAEMVVKLYKEIKRLKATPVTGNLAY